MADGSLNFDTKIDTEGFLKGANTLKGQMGKVVSSINKTGGDIGRAFTGASSAVMRVENSLKTTEQAMKKLNSEMSEFASKKIPTEEFVAVNKQLEDANAKYNALQEKQDRFLATGGKKSSTAFKNMNYDAEQLKGTMASVQGELDDLVASGKAFTLGKDFSEYSDMQMKYLGLADKAEVYRQKLAELDKQQNKVSGSSKKMNKSMKSTNKTVIPLTKSILKLSNMFKLMVLRMAIRKVIDAVKEGFQNLAQYSNQTNKDLSRLMTSLQTLKNSFATAFAPILTVVVPILDTFIRYLSNAISVAGQFFAVFLTGASTFTKAKDAQVDYAESLKKTNEEAKKAKRTLASFDDLDVLNPEDTALDVPSTPTPEDMFEEVEINPKLTEAVNDLKIALDPTIQAIERFKTALEPLKTFSANAIKDFYNMALVPIGKWVLGTGLPRFIDAISNGLSRINYSYINTALQGLWRAIAPFAKNVGEGLLWFFEKVLVPLAVWTINNILPLFLKALTAAITILNTIIEALRPYAIWLFDNFLVPLAEWTGGVIVDFLKMLVSNLEKFSSWAKSNEQAIANISVTVLSFFAGMWLYNTAQNLGAFLMGLTTAFKTLAGGITIAGASALMANIGFGLLLGAIGLLALNWDKMNGLEKVTGILGLLAVAAFAAAIAVGLFQTAWSLGIAAAAIVVGMGAIVFAVTSASKRAESSLGGLDPNQRQHSSNFSIPRLATGTVVPANYGEYAAILGDNKREPEIVSPLSTMEQAMENVLARRGGTGEGKDIIIKASGTIGELIRFLKFELDKEDSRVGVKLIEDGGKA